MFLAIAILASVPTVFADDNVSILQGSSDESCRTLQGCLSPVKISINVGDTITWTNEDSVTHEILSWDGPAQLGQTFQSGALNTGDVFEYTFTETGTLWYYSAEYPWIEGRVIVLDNSESEAEKESDLQLENDRLKLENEFLKDQIAQLEDQLAHLQELVLEQVRVILDVMKEVRSN